MFTTITLIGSTAEKSVLRASVSGSALLSGGVHCGGSRVRGTRASFAGLAPIAGMTTGVRGTEAVPAQGWAAQADAPQAYGTAVAAHTVKPIFARTQGAGAWSPPV
ncbi:hypothetical protein [Nocardioides sp. GY 10127]|uniref:hypothetical protein n=1 Tax=Nocardioides sp. GY 10127 TaxID=2569762 RepID=UPI0010A8D78B|nr:hypothetical protein [Nocardioides sp. GY 10127]TIC84181.1 hypothetical protein E8D37_05115 [Nocardioides sp. GY 10127]